MHIQYHHMTPCQYLYLATPVTKEMVKITMALLQCICFTGQSHCSFWSHTTAGVGVASETGYLFSVSSEKNDDHQLVQLLL